ncbi:MAG: hypothetical protein EXR72_19980 [Myxococcales bacterium]|nr:hypothetical protein [Myxococcales bacterium]
MRLLAVLPFALAAWGGGRAWAAEIAWLAASDEGRLPCGVPAGWHRPEVDDAALTAGRDGGNTDGGSSPCEALRIRRRFDVGPAGARLATVTLRARYRDGIVAWLNGVEIARRRLPEGAGPAIETHGPEPESFVVPVTAGLLREKGNLLAVEVRAATPSRTATAEVALSGADGVRIVRGPWLQRVIGGEGWLHLETDLPSRAVVRYARLGATEEPREAGDDQPRTRHALHLTRLAPATAWSYRVTVSAEGLPGGEIEARFHTPPAPGHPLRFAVFGDVRSGHAVHDQIARAVAAEDPDLAIVTGDLVDRGTDEGDWERFFDVAAPLLRQVAIYPAVGNHEYLRRGRGRERFLALFREGAKEAWWSFDVAGVHFVCLDSEALANPAQLIWLEHDLQAARKGKPRAIIAYGHDGPWSSALHGDNAAAIRDYVPVLERHRVTVIFSGHDHDYERGKVGGLDYVVSGGGGAELREPRCTVEPGQGTGKAKRRCGPRVRAFVNEHHYLMVEVQKDRLRICPKRPDGTLLEACPTIPLRR